MRADVKGFLAADAGQRAGGDVANRVAASLAGSDAHALQLAQDTRNIFNRHVVILNVLSRGDVAHAARVLFRNVAEFRELLSSHPAARQLHANHVRVRATNPVNAMLQACWLENIGIELAASVLLDLRDEAVIFGYIFPAMLGRDWYVRDGHKNSLPTKNLP